MFPISHLFLGEGATIGANKEGTIEALSELAKKENFSLCPVKRLRYENQDISTTRIKEAIFQKDFSLVKRLLGRNYGIFLYPDEKNFQKKNATDLSSFSLEKSNFSLKISALEEKQSYSKIESSSEEAEEDKEKMQQECKEEEREKEQGKEKAHFEEDQYMIQNGEKEEEKPFLSETMRVFFPKKLFLPLPGNYKILLKSKNRRKKTLCTLTEKGGMILLEDFPFSLDNQKPLFCSFLYEEGL
jgi:hypothetical protein